MFDGVKVLVCFLVRWVVSVVCSVFRLLNGVCMFSLVSVISGCCGVSCRYLVVVLL